MFCALRTESTAYRTRCLNTHDTLLTIEHAIYASNRENLKTLYLLNSLGALTLTSKYSHVYAFSQFRYIVQYNEEAGIMIPVKKRRKRNSYGNNNDQSRFLECSDNLLSE